MADKPLVQIGPFTAASGKKVDKALGKIALKEMQKAAKSAFKKKFTPVEKTSEKQGFHYSAKLLECYVDGANVKVKVKCTAYRLEKMKPMIQAETGAAATGKPEVAVGDAIWGTLEANIKSVVPKLLKLK